MLTFRWFQSLIGRLKTSGTKEVTMLYIMFQSLIGRLKTAVLAVMVANYENVSIPHR